MPDGRPQARELTSGRSQARNERGEYPSEDDARQALRAHRRLAEEISAAHPAETERIARPSAKAAPCCHRSAPAGVSMPRQAGEEKT